MIDRTFSFSGFFLVCLTLVSSPLLAQSAPSLELQSSDIQGSVEFQRSDSSAWHPLRENHVLHQGDRVKTGPAGSVTLTMPGVSVTEVEPESTLTIRTLGRESETRETLLGTEDITVNNIEMDVETGELKNAVESPSGVETNYNLETNNAVAGVRGTTFELERRSPQSVAVSVLEGNVQFSRPGDGVGAISVGENQRSFLEGGNPDPTITDLPEENREELSNFRDRAEGGLRQPPQLSDFQLNGNSFEESISLAYDEVGSLTLTGTARAVEDDQQLSRLMISAPGMEDSVELTGEEDRWSYEFSPAVAEPGSRRTITLTLRVEGDQGARSTSYNLELELVHPEESGDVDLESYETDGVSIDVTDAEARLVRDNPAVQSALRQLEELRTSFNEQDLTGLLEPVPGGAVIETPQGQMALPEVRSRLEVLFPVLSSPQWTMTVRGINYDEQTGLARFNIESDYGGQLVELLGVNPETLEGDPDNVSRKRPIQSLEASRSEQYNFNLSGNEATLQSLTPGWFLTAANLEEARRQIARWRVKSAVFGLFYFYEESSPGTFRTLIAPSFQNNDDNEFNHGRQDFLSAVRSDLDNLNGVQYSVRVETIQFQGGFDNARVEVNWDRNARLGNTNQLWQITDQSTTFILNDNAGMALTRISGDPVFGLSSAQTQSTLIRAGTLDDQSNFSPKVVTSSGEVIDFTGELFPEITAEESTEIANEGCISGTISSDPTSSQTWCGVEITNNITIPSGVVITVQDGSEVNVASGVGITIEGELDGTGCTFQPVASGWGENVAGGEKGLKVVPGTGSNGTLQLDGCSVTGVHGALELAAGAGSLDVDLLNSTVEGLGDGTTRELIKINKDNTTFRVENTTLRARRDGIRMLGASRLELIGSTLEPLSTANSRYGINVAGSGADLELRGNTIQSFQNANVSISTQITGFYSTENTYIGVSGNNGNLGVDYAPSNASSVSLIFENDIFKRHGSYAICNRTAGTTCGDANPGVDPVEIYFSDFIDNGTAAAVPAIDGGWPSFGPSSLMEGCYLQENNTSLTITTSQQTPDDGQGSVIQYEDMSAVIIPQNSPNNL